MLSSGVYFITICVENRRNLLGKAVGGDAHIAPHVELSDTGKIMKRYIENIDLQTGVLLDHYVIMPNHIHLLIRLDNGMMWASSPTQTASAIIPGAVRSFKILVTKQIGYSIWQRSYHDHIIRNQSKYQIIWRYIDNNPATWQKDRYFVADE